MKTTDEIVQLASLGVGLIVDAKQKTTMDLMKIINAAFNSDGHVTLRNCDSKIMSDLRQLCLNNPKTVTVDLT